MDTKELEDRQQYAAYGWAYPETPLVLDEIDKDIIHNHALTVAQWNSLCAYARERQKTVTT